jgi:A/G-specific adenine glycosylase
MPVSAAELLGGDDIARRDLPRPSPGVTAWQIPVSEFMLKQTPVARVQPSGSTWVTRWLTPTR